MWRTIGAHTDNLSWGPKILATPLCIRVQSLSSYAVSCCMNLSSTLQDIVK